MTDEANTPSALSQETLAVFVKAITAYFDRIMGIPAETETPYIQEGPTEFLEVTAVIGVSGDLQGCVHFTAPSSLLNRLLEFVGEEWPTDELRRDMAGEVANTLSGNARRQLGSGFMISVPVIHHEKPEPPAKPKGSTSFVIPILWQEMRARLVIRLSEPPPSFDI